MFGKKQKNKRSLFERMFGVAKLTQENIVVSVSTQEVTPQEVRDQTPIILSYPDFSYGPDENSLEERLSYPDFSVSDEKADEQSIVIVVNDEEMNRGSARTLKPHRQISDNERFILVSGEKLQTLHELRNTLRGMPIHVWKAHVSPERNDFANWIEYVSQDPLLSYHCRACPTPEALRALLSVSL